MNTRIVPFREAAGKLSAILRETRDGALGFWYGMLFAGDRGMCCDEAAIAETESGEFAAVASIAPNGEQDSGEPTLVGPYTLPQFRRQGYGRAALEAAVRRCLERGFTKVHVDALTTGAMAVNLSLPEDLHAVLVIRDQTAFGAMLPP